VTLGTFGFLLAKKDGLKPVAAFFATVFENGHTYFLILQKRRNALLQLHTMPGNDTTIIDAALQS
jgi:hypothetical protein